jgi:putative acetyltransferase
MRPRSIHKIVFEEKEIGSEPTNELVLRLTELFFDTVHSVNVCDYTEEQIDTWAPENINHEKWKDRIRDNYLILAEDGSKVVGFGELTVKGCIDMLYVDEDYLLQKIGQQLLERIIGKARELNINEVLVEASVTSKPFFENQGFNLIKRRVKKLNKVDFIIFKMKKRI